VSFERKSQGCFEVKYATVEDMAPGLQRNLREAVRKDTQLGPVCILFKVDTMDVPKAVPEFWLEVTRELSPRLCALAVVSDSLAVRVIASGFGISNRVRQVKVSVKAFTRAQLDEAKSWCREHHPLPA
jgi:hypothetical protein